jgi:hypothetical protein
VWIFLDFLNLGVITHRHLSFTSSTFPLSLLHPTLLFSRYIIKYSSLSPYLPLLNLNYSLLSLRLYIYDSISRHGLDDQLVNQVSIKLSHIHLLFLPSLLLYLMRFFFEYTLMHQYAIRPQSQLEAFPGLRTVPYRPS